MGDTNTSNGVSANKRSMSVKEEKDEEVTGKVQQFAGEGNTIYVACGGFSTEEISLSKNSGDPADPATGKKESEMSQNGCIVMDSTLMQSLKIVEGPGILISVKGKDKKLEREEQQEQENDGQEKE